MNKIAILDFGSQFAHLLANRVRRLGVYSEILDGESAATELTGYKGIIISGGPTSVNAPDAPKVDPAIYELGIPILGVCYGHQITMKTLGGRVDKGQVGEYGLTRFTVEKAEGVLAQLEPKTYQVYASHFDAVAELPEGFEPIGATQDDKLSATINRDRKIYTVQFHPEVTHTQCGMQIIDEFINITGAKRDWSIEKFIERELATITEKVGDKKVFMLVSGGVDSSVAYVLLAKALGPDRIYAMYVDTGFMRKNETEEIKRFLSQAGVENLHVEYAADEYFAALEGVYEPEVKRKIIGDLFLKIQRRVTADLGLNPDEWLLGQGTIYPDTIESAGTKHSDKIKTHHNRVPEIEEMIRQGRVIEPLKELYKDEVRMVGTSLGLSNEMVHRHPFPGPALAVRCLCVDPSAQPEPTQDLGEIESYKTHMLPIKSVGVQGDERTYRHPLVLEGNHDWDKLRHLAPKITNAHKEVNRVLITLATNGPIAEIHPTPNYLTRERIALLQEADKLVMETIYRIDKADRLAERSLREADATGGSNKFQGKVWQCPTVLLPISINTEGQESIVLRPISSTEAMTANFTELPWPEIQELAQKLLALPGISAVFYDITNKPPGTIEWE